MYSNSMHNNTMMRRGNNGVKTVAIVVAALLFLYGLYAYHDLHSRHKRSEEKSDRLRQQHDSLSAQLQVVYEQKSRLDKLLQQEKADHKQSKDDLTNDKRRSEQKFLMEKQELLNRVNSINSEYKMLQGQHEDLQNTFSKVQDQLLRLEEDFKKTSDQNSQEFQQLKQEKDNEIAQLKDQVANYERRNNDLQGKLQAAIQQSQINQNQVEAGQERVAQLQEQLAQLQQGQVLNQNVRLPAQNLGNQVQNGQFVLSNKLQNLQPPQQLRLPQQHNAQQANLIANLPHDQQQQVQQWQQQQQPQQQIQQLPQQLQQQQQFGQNAQVFDQQGQQYPQQVDQGMQQHQQQQQQQQQQPQQQGFPQQAQQPQEFQQQHDQQQNEFQQNIPQQQDQIHQQQVPQQQDYQQEQKPQEAPVVMQVAQPGDNQKPYFDPKEAKPDHEMGIGHNVEQDDQDHDNGEIQHQQMAAPQLGLHDMQREDIDKAEEQAKLHEKVDSHVVREHDEAKRFGDPNWRNVQEVENDEDKLLDRGGFNRINAFDRGGVPLQGPQPNLDGIIEDDQYRKNDGDMNRGPGQIVGPDVKNQGERIEAPVAGDDLNKGPFQMDNIQEQRDDQQNNLPVPVIHLQAQQQDDENQLALPVRGQNNDELYQDKDNQDENDEGDEADGDNDNGDQLHYPN